MKTLACIESVSNEIKGVDFKEGTAYSYVTEFDSWSGKDKTRVFSDANNSILLTDGHVSRYFKKA